MRAISKVMIGGFIMLAVIISIFIFALRGCLSAYDQRYAVAPPVIVTTKDSSVLVSLVVYQQTTSYEQDGGFTRKTYRNSYFLQSNSFINGQKLFERKLQRNEAKPATPAVLGVDGRNVWLFLDGLKSFDAISLLPTADIQTIEAKNPLLKDNLPSDKQYYSFDDTAHLIHIKARDGSRWMLHTTTLIAAPDTKRPGAAELNIRHVFAGRPVNYNEMYVSQDTSAARWTGIYSAEEWGVLSPNVSITAAYGHDEQRKIFVSRYKENVSNAPTIVTDSLPRTLSSTAFLDGGFLVDLQTGLPAKTPGYLLVSKSEIGTAGTILLTCITTYGKIVWTLNTHLQNWIEWRFHAGQLLVSGRHLTTLSPDQCSMFLIVDLSSGKAVRYEYLPQVATEGK